MPLIFPLAFAGLMALFAGTACDHREDEIIIGPEPPPKSPKPVSSREDLSLNNPIFNRGPGPFTEENKKLFLAPFSKSTFERALSPGEKLSLRKLHYKTDRWNLFSGVLSFGRSLDRNGKPAEAQIVYQQLLQEKFPVPLEIRDMARRELTEHYQMGR